MTARGAGTWVAVPVLMALCVVRAAGQSAGGEMQIAEPRAFFVWDAFVFVLIRWDTVIRSPWYLPTFD